MRRLRRQLPRRSHLALIQRVMESKKPIGNFSGRLFCLLMVLVPVLFLPGYLKRELWFDEALTLQFALLPTAKDIYFSYTIPNNQIVHSVILHYLFNWGIAPETARLFPLICALLMIFLLWKNFHREVGKAPLLLSLAALIISPVFLLYATALRGYMLAALLVVSALICGKKFALGGRWIMLCGWGVFSLLACGVMPSALAGIAAAGLYIVPYCGKKFWKSRKLWLLGAMPFAGFLLFYLPVWDKLLKAFELKEGWNNGFYAALAVALALVTTFTVPLICAAVFHRRRWRDLPRTMIWLLPLGGMILPVAPYPRVWFVIFPVTALLCAGFLRRMPEKAVKIAGVAVLLWGALTLPEFSRALLSPAVTLAGQDDFFAPRFARELFTPHAAVRFAKSHLEHRGMVPVFVSFEADPFAVIYAAGGKLHIIPDIPPGKFTQLPDNSLVILATEEAPELFERRFSGKLYRVYQNMLHRVYRFRRSL